MLAPAFVLIAASAEAQTIALDGIVITSTKTEEAAIDVLGGSSAIGRTQLDTEFQPDKVSEVLRTMPGVTTQETARDTATAVNIRGLQDFGRVNILIEGARQNFQRSGHTANGVFYIEPEMIKRVDVTRGPTATIYGSGAIGGVVAFDLLDADDILKPGETMAGRLRTRGSTNDEGKLASQTAAVRIGNFDIVGQLNGRWSNDYKDGDGNVVPGSNDTTKSGFLKARWRLAPGHTLTGTYIGFNSKFEDQVDSEGALRDTAVNNRQMTLGYTFTSPSNPLIDFNAKVYKNTTELEQIRKTSTSATQYDPSLFPFFPPAPYPPAACAHIPGSTPIFVGQGACSSTTTFPSGSQRSFNVDTVGFDVHNTSRLNWGSTGLALTYGGDLFRDRVNNFDPFEAGDELTPSGERQVSGAFIQAHLKMFDTVDVIGAMRYDSYQLESNTTQNSGERVSPKATIGYTPLPGFTFFTTYAEGYRAPA
ncbi:MAG: TonB-dependent receptor, partial [Hyphomicrobiaceae bacterium]